MFLRRYGMILFLVLLALYMGYALRGDQTVPAGAQAAKLDAFTTAEARKTLRCGYIEWPPYLMRDPNTNALSGFTYTLANQLAANLGWKVDWVMPVLLGQEDAAMRSGGIDAICGAQVPINPRQALFLDHSLPYGLLPAFAYVRYDAPQTSLSALNDPNIMVTTMDGDISPILRQNFLPLTKEHALPNNIDPKQMSLDVMYRKADVALLDVPSFVNFNKTHPNKLRRIESAPLAIYPMVISVAKGETRLQKTISDTIAYMHNSGQIAKIFRDHKLLELGVMGVMAVGNDT